MLFTGLEVRIEKYLPEVSKMAWGRRSRDIFETEGKMVKNLFFSKKNVLCVGFSLANQEAGFGRIRSGKRNNIMFLQDKQ